MPMNVVNLRELTKRHPNVKVRIILTVTDSDNLPKSIEAEVDAKALVDLNIKTGFNGLDEAFDECVNQILTGEKPYRFEHPGKS